jgi:phage-related holin
MRDNMRNDLINNTIYTLVTLILTVLNPEAVMILSVFILIDIMTGIFADARIKGVNKITSKRLSFGILFKLMMLLIPMIVVLTGRGIGLDLHMLAVWSLNMLIVSEALSIIGNIQEIKTGKEVAEMDAVNLILGKIRNVLIDFLEKK